MTVNRKQKPIWNLASGRIVRWRFLLVAGWILHSIAGWSSQWRPLAIEELTGCADLVVQGKTISRQCKRDEAGRIYTEATLAVTEIWKGKHAGTCVSVVHSGGAYAGETLTVTGQVEYPLGEDVVAFLAVNPRGMYVTVGLSQGKFQVIREPLGNQMLARNRFHGLEPGASVSAQQPSGRRTLSLSELKRRVQACLR